MATSLAKRRVTNFTHNILGITKTSKPRLRVPHIDVRNSKKQHIPFGNNGFSRSQFHTSLSHKLSSLKDKYSQSKEKVSSHTLHTSKVREMLTKRLLSKRNDHPQASVNTLQYDSFLQLFTSRIKDIHIDTKMSPFTERSIHIEKNTVEFLYHHILGQLFHIKPTEFTSNPVLLFKEIQTLIRKGLDRMLTEVKDLSLEFNTSILLKHINTIISEMLENIKEFGHTAKEFTMRFVPFYEHEKTSFIGVY